MYDLAGMAFAQQSELRQDTLEFEGLESLSGPRHRSEDIRELAMLVAPNHSPEASDDLVRFLSPNSSLYDSRELWRLWDQASGKLNSVRRSQMIYQGSPNRSLHISYKRTAFLLHKTVHLTFSFWPAIFKNRVASASRLEEGASGISRPLPYTRMGGISYGSMRPLTPRALTG